VPSAFRQTRPPPPTEVDRDATLIEIDQYFADVQAHKEKWGPPDDSQGYRSDDPDDPDDPDFVYDPNFFDKLDDELGLQRPDLLADAAV
jgi:hypothetical protein